MSDQPPWHVVECGEPRRVHVLPVFPGEREHVASPECWCHPTPDSAEPRVLVHHRRAEA